jgi:triosephosphate isomerase (TIM)
VARELKKNRPHDEKKYQIEMRKKIVAGNWKMNTSLADGTQLMTSIMEQMPPLEVHQHVIFCAPFTHLFSLDKLNKKTNIHLGAQNCNSRPSGAFTGEISISMLKETGVTSVIIGHSERRQLFAETNDVLKQKVDALVNENMLVLFCCGEPLSVRETNTQNEYVANQLAESLFHLSAEVLTKNVVIAYEPIWAIGTGVTATTEQAQEMHAFIRNLIATNYESTTSNNMSILYGGSCNAQNAQELFACKDVDGGLIGGAALKVETFMPIIAAMQ